MAGNLPQHGGDGNTGSRKFSAKLQDTRPRDKKPIPPRTTQLKEVDKKNSRRKHILGRKSSLLQFSSKPVTRTFRSEEEGVQEALKKFRDLHARQRAAQQPSSQAAVVVLKEMKERYPYLLVNKRHGGEGLVPGVEVGQRFRYRAELCLVGLHRPPMKGIDWKDVPTSDGSVINIALSIVDSGKYEENKDEGEVLTYSGEGGRNNKGQQCADQKLEGGNLALHNSSVKKNSVRVIRRRRGPTSSGEGVYSYDGLYKVVSCIVKRTGPSKFRMYTFQLVREEGQKPLQLLQ